MHLLVHHPPNHVRVHHWKNLLINNAAQVALIRRVILRKYAGKGTKYGSTCGSQHHDALVLSWDGQVDEGQAHQVPRVLLTTVSGQAHHKGGKDVGPTTVADHGDPVMLVPNAVQIVELSFFPTLL
jgi:hypothetical protein